MNIVMGLKANVIVAQSGLREAASLARLGVDDGIRSLIAHSFDDVDGALAVLASRDAQVFVGPGVNYASQARTAVQALRTSMASGPIPPSAIDGVLGHIEPLAARIAALA